MSQDWSKSVERSHADPEHPSGSWEAARIGFFFVTLIRLNEAWAGTPVLSAAATARSNDEEWHRSSALSADMIAVPWQFRPPTAIESRTDSTPVFRRPAWSMTNPSVLQDVFDRAPMLQGTSVWQRMAECRTNSRIRLINLWRSSGNSVSLQAGKHGDPSLQWIYRPEDPRVSTRGLLDPVISLAHLTNRKSPPLVLRAVSSLPVHSSERAAPTR